MIISPLWNIQIQTNVVVDVDCLWRIAMVLWLAGKVGPVKHTLCLRRLMNDCLRRLMDAWRLLIAILIVFIWIIDHLWWVVLLLADSNDLGFLIFFKVFLFSRDHWLSNFRHQLLFFIWLNAPETFVTRVSNVWKSSRWCALNAMAGELGDFLSCCVVHLLLSTMLDLGSILFMWSIEIASYKSWWNHWLLIIVHFKICHTCCN